MKTLNTYSAPRPVNPDYLTVSDDLQVLLSPVYASSSSSAASWALAAGASSIKAAASATPGT